jgi:hypothetical protein
MGNLLEAIWAQQVSQKAAMCSSLTQLSATSDCSAQQRQPIAMQCPKVANGMHTTLYDDSSSLPEGPFVFVLQVSKIPWQKFLVNNHFFEINYCERAPEPVACRKGTERKLRSFRYSQLLGCKGHYLQHSHSGALLEEKSVFTQLF